VTEELLELLKKELLSLEKSASQLRASYEKCQKIGVRSEYSFQELEALEALTARFSRLSDLLIQKIFRLIDSIELVDEGSVLDRINRAEKRDLVATAKQFVELRRLRNTIVHEYEPDEYTRIFKDVLDFSPLLLDSVQRVQRYCQKFYIEK
jgi:hypothetical protein